MYANVNQKACIQCGLCPSICPEVFSLDDGAPAHAITDAVPEDCRLTAQDVVRHVLVQRIIAAYERDESRREKKTPEHGGRKA